MADAATPPAPQLIRYDGGRGDGAAAQTVDAVGNIYIAGSTKVGTNPITFAVMKFNPQGNLVWRALYSGSQGGVQGVAGAVTVDGAGNVYATGSISNGAVFGQNHDALVVKLSPTGQEQWARRYDNGDFDQGRKIAVDQTGAVYIGGSSTGSSGGNDWLTQRYGADGTLQWTKRFTSPGTVNDNLADMMLTPAGNLAVTGTVKDKGDGLTNAAATLVYDAQGNVVWQRHFADTASSDDIPADMDIDPSGNITVTGMSARTAAPRETEGAPITIRYTSTGNALPVIRAGGNAVRADAAGNLYLAGGIERLSGKAAVAKYAATGTQVWSTPVTLPSDSFFIKGIVADMAGNVTVAGTTTNRSTGNRDYLTIRYTPTGQEQWQHRFEGAGASSRADEVADITLVPNTGAALVTGTSDNTTLSSREDIVALKFS
ncbi:hypothetical protein ACWCQZ_48880 [Streptomyces sp. NPDC002285]